MTAATERPTVARPLAGHVSPESAYVVEDYPYGFRLRCKMRHWIEHRPGHGFRHVTQTSNPKKAGEVWNKPKAGTYAPVLVLTVDADGRVWSDGLGTYASEERIAAFEERHGAALGDEQRAAVARLRAMNAAAARVTYTVRDAGYATIDGRGLTVHADREAADAYRAGAAAVAPEPPAPDPAPRQAVTAGGTAYLLPGIDPAPAKRGDADQLAIF